MFYYYRQAMALHKEGISSDSRSQELRPSREGESGYGADEGEGEGDEGREGGAAPGKSTMHVTHELCPYDVLTSNVGKDHSYS
jgi:hypothetical protein